MSWIACGPALFVLVEIGEEPESEPHPSLPFGYVDGLRQLANGLGLERLALSLCQHVRRVQRPGAAVVVDNVAPDLQDPEAADDLFVGWAN